MILPNWSATPKTYFKSAAPPSPGGVGNDELISIFLNIRRTKIEEIILSEQLKLQMPEEQHDEILEYLDFLNTVKIDIANKLGNVVSRF